MAGNQPLDFVRGARLAAVQTATLSSVRRSSGARNSSLPAMLLVHGGFQGFQKHEGTSRALVLVRSRGNLRDADLHVLCWSLVHQAVEMHATAF